MKHVEDSSSSRPPVPGPTKVSEIPPIPAAKQTTEAPPTPASTKPVEAPPIPSQVKSATGPTPAPRVPMPGSLPSQRDDPYAIKKQFIGAGKSSYVPQVKPRDNSSIPHGFNDVSENRQVVRESDEAGHVESNEPKMSLKERIAMLQKRQQEEAEREAAALKKKEERKRKTEEDKKLKAPQADNLPEHEDSLAAEADHSSQSPSDPISGAEAASPNAIARHDSGASSVVERDDSHHKETDAPDIATSHPSKPTFTGSKLEDHGIDESKEKEETEEEDKEIEEAEEDEDDEDLRRKRLVERMAKISGGRNMFGMMGMPSPFGSTPAPSSKSKKQTREPAPAPVPAPAPARSPDVSESLSSPVEKVSKVGIPIPGIVPQLAKSTTGDTSADDKTSHSKETTESTDIVDDEEGDISEEFDENKIDAQASKKDVAKQREVKSTVEIQTQDSAPGVPSRETSHKDGEVHTSNMSIVEDSTQDASIAGYEADADISDRGLAEKDQTAPKSTQEHTDGTARSVPLTPLPPKSEDAPPPPPPPPLINHTVDPASAPSIPTPPIPTPSTRPPVPSAETSTKSTIPPVPSEDAPLSPKFHESLLDKTHSTAPPVPSGAIPSIPSIGSPRQAPELPEHQPPPVPPPNVTSEPISASNKKAPPPVPTAPPAPPVELDDDNSSDDADTFDERDDDSSDSNLQVVDPQRGFLDSKSHTFSTPAHVSASEFNPSVPIRNSTTNSLKRSSVEFSRKSTELRRSGSFKDGRAGEQEQANFYLAAIQAELADLGQTSGWWIKSSIPDSLSSKLGVDLEYEVDENRLQKRGGREVIYKDYYILFHDFSQIIFEIQYQSDDPRDTVDIGSFKVIGSPKIRKDLLHGYSSSLGHHIAEFAEKCIGSKLGAGVVEEAFNQLKSKNYNVLKPVGEKAFGVTVYRNFNNNVARVDEIRPGDILCMRSAKFPSHKGLAGLASKSITVGEGNDVYAAVVVEYDPKKDKVKVAESGKSGTVKKESYKFGELKSGRIRVFRVVSRDSVGW
ncbi:hypothetical protein JCM33374_g4590 [Metschnikowia sp. JCM 33374]|nr:hypothetical protein JCM33374_g4590 [Metschnikowia sp. JCM 33374]